MLVRYGRDLRYHFVSQAYADMLGRPPEEFVGKSLIDIIGAQEFGEIRPYVDAVLGGEAVDYVREIRYPHAGVRYLRVSYQPEWDQQGNVSGWITSILDLTGQREADRARQQLASIVESSNDAIISKNLDGVIVSWNPSAERLFGYSADEIVGKPITLLIPPALHDQEPLQLDRLRRGEAIKRYETVRRRKDGSIVHVSVSESPVRDSDGKIVGASKICRDITDRKRNLTALSKRANEQAALYRFTDRLYRAATLPDVYEAALDTIVEALHCSRASVLLFDDRGVMQFVAWRGLSDTYRRAHPVHLPWQQDEVNPEPLCVENLDRSELPEALKVVVEKEGIGALAFIPLMLGGKLAGKFMAYYSEPHAFARDDIDFALSLARQLGFAITRMRAERARSIAEGQLLKLSASLEADAERRRRERDRIWSVSEDLLGVTNFEGRFLSINPAWTRLLGWSEDEIKSMHVSELRHPDDAAHAEGGRQQLAQGVATVRMENRFRHRDGSWRWIYWTMTADEGLIYVAGRHVTSEREAAAALERAHVQSAHLQKMEALGQLTGGVAHDFNNLLMIVSGHAQRLSHRLIEPKDVRSLQAIQMAASRGESLTRQLLSFSRSQPLHPVVLNPADTMQAIRDVLSGSIGVNIEFASDIPRTIWPVYVDKSELELALVNLAVNARDAMPNGGRLSITAENVELHKADTPQGLTGDFVVLKVSDTGSGIPPDLLAKVFEPFFTTKGADKGTGLGLSQVYGFAQRSGGTVAIASGRGHGTTVMLYLPRSVAALEEPSEEQPEHYMAQGDNTVLVVEDNPDVRIVTVSLLEQLGYRTIAVESAPAALDIMAESKVSLVFTDVVLPGRIDGLALGRILNERYPALPIVLTTGYAKVFDANPEYPVLRKPYQISTLGRTIRDALERAKPSPRAAAN